MKTKWILLLVAVVVSLCFGACSKENEIELVEPETELTRNAGGNADTTDSEQAGVAGSNLSGIIEKIPTEQTGRSSSDADGKNEGAIYVFVCGAVKYPGVYQLNADARVFEAVGAAGGFETDADENYVNQAERLADGVKLYIPSKEEVQELTAKAQGSTSGDAAGGEHSKTGNTGSTGGVASNVFGVTAGESSGASNSTQSGISASGLVNINTASAEELQTISGIGATRAQAIIGYREANGGFATIEDVMKVSGIKTAVFNQIKNQITVN